MNEVTLTLKEYTDLIIENNNLKRLVKNFNKKVEKEIKGYINEQRISKLNKEKTLSFLNENNYNNLLKEFYTGYSWTMRDIILDNYEIVTEAELKETTITIIRNMLTSRLTECEIEGE